MLIFLMTLAPLVVLLGRKPGETIFVDVDAKRAYVCERNVHAEIEFVPVDQEGVVDVLADNERFILRNLTGVICKEYAFALRAGRRLYNPLSLWLLCHPRNQLIQSLWKHEAFRQEFEMTVTM